MKKSLKLLLVILLYILIFPLTFTYADSLPTLTIVNPIRGPELGLEKADLKGSLMGQWQATKNESVTATWLWQYSALENKELVNFAKNNMKDQEHGLFFEIDKNTAEKAGVDYKGKSAWYHSDGLLLSSYDKNERVKIIDTVFKKFKQIFGYYPTSIGAWWVGAESIEYMEKKYGISGVLQCADQFNTDAYSIWGTPWSIPYLPSAKNAAIPAKKGEDSKTVVMQWAPRDPGKGYGPGVKDSTFSLQDYELKGYDLRYFEYLSSVYLQKPSDQVVFGLEGGLPANAYSHQYAKQLQKASEWRNQHTYKIQSMKEYAKEFLSLSQRDRLPRFYLAKAFDSNNQSFWYQSSAYRVGISKQDERVEIIDIRDYANSSNEDYYDVPNVESVLHINVKSKIDSVKFPKQKIVLGTYDLPLQIEESTNSVTLKSGEEKIAIFTPSAIILNNKKISFNTGINWSEKILKYKILTRIDAEKTQNNIRQYFNLAFSGKKNFLLFLILAYGGLGILLIPLILFHQRNIKLSVIVTGIYLIATSFFYYDKIIKNRGIIATPYELEAITFVKKQNKQVTYLSPQNELAFRAVRPILYAKPQIAEAVSNKKWTIISRSGKENIVFKKGTALIVPLFLGMRLNHEEIEMHKLQKVFDNAQIAIYE